MGYSLCVGETVLFRAFECRVIRSTYSVMIVLTFRQYSFSTLMLHYVGKREERGREIERVTRLGRRKEKEKERKGGRSRVGERERGM